MNQSKNQNLKNPIIEKRIENNLNITQNNFNKNNSPLNISTMNINIFQKNFKSENFGIIPQNLLDMNSSIRHLQLNANNQSKPDGLCRVNSNKLFEDGIPLNDSTTFTTQEHQKFLLEEKKKSEIGFGNQTNKIEHQSTQNPISYKDFDQK